jgi:hypothetical protein
MDKIWGSLQKSLLPLSTSSLLFLLNQTSGDITQNVFPSHGFLAFKHFYCAYFSAVTSCLLPFTRKLLSQKCLCNCSCCYSSSCALTFSFFLLAGWWQICYLQHCNYRNIYALKWMDLPTCCLIWEISNICGVRVAWKGVLPVCQYFLN